MDLGLGCVLPYIQRLLLILVAWTKLITNPIDDTLPSLRKLLFWQIHNGRHKNGLIWSISQAIFDIKACF